MPDSLLFDAATFDTIEVTNPNVLGTGALSIMVVAKFGDDAARYENFIGIDGLDSWLGTDNTTPRHVNYYPGTGGGAAESTYETPSSDGWCLFGYTHPNAGAGTFHKYRYDTQVWDHDLTVGAPDDPVMAASLWIGSTGGPHQWFNGNMLIIGVWDRELSEAEVESLYPNLAAWEAAVPKQAWRLNVLSGLTSLAGTSTEIGRTGTALDAGDAPAGWSDGGEEVFLAPVIYGRGAA